MALRVVLDITDKMLDSYKLLLEPGSSQEPGTIQSLLNTIDKLNRERAVVGNTVVKLESYHPSGDTPPKVVKSSSESRKLDLEMAVLMQELLSMREDKAELRARIYNLEHEKDVLEMKLNSHEMKEMSEEVGNSVNDPDEKSSENKLREKLKEMSQTLDRVTRTYELRQMQASQLTDELKQANSSLLSSLEKGKKKSQSRLKRLENEIVIMAERHCTQVTHLKQRIGCLEETITRLKS